MINLFTQQHDWPTAGSLIDAINNSIDVNRGKHRYARWCQALHRASRAAGQRDAGLYRRVR